MPSSHLEIVNWILVTMFSVCTSHFKSGWIVQTWIKTVLSGCPASLWRNWMRFVWAAGLHICQCSHIQQHTGHNSAETLPPLLHSGSQMLDYEILVSVWANFHILLEVLVTMNVPGIGPPHCTLIFYFQKFYRRTLCIVFTDAANFHIRH